MTAEKTLNLWLDVLHGSTYTAPTADYASTQWFWGLVVGAGIFEKIEETKRLAAEGHPIAAELVSLVVAERLK